ncbi:hypothetical protein V5799_023298 [Amblyomma americanum]|uniref:Uncharacterized protein n=1 Tax=Amblyomma americanum TaxID=6943 RepID=A0AAQ4FIQ0_AMBAM
MESVMLQDRTAIVLTLVTAMATVHTEPLMATATDLTASPTATLATSASVQASQLECLLRTGTAISEDPSTSALQ